MDNQPASMSIYTDFSGLTELKSRSSRDAPGARKEVAKQFEALFIQMMLKSMRDAGLEGTDSDQIKFYQEMFDKQIALSLAEGKGMGLASAFERHISGDAAVVSKDTGVIPAPINKPRTPAVLPEIPLSDLVAVKKIVQSVQTTSDIGRADTNQINSKQTDNGRADSKAAVSGSEAIIRKDVNDWQPASPKEFIRELWPHARKAADKLGVEPEVLIAQSALETGWGQKMTRDRDGSPSFNLFNIKAGRGWQGGRVGVATLEYRDGIASREHASFRSYQSLAESMRDYTNFLQTNPRYQSALQVTADAGRYLDELQRAGYATDPRYAEKIGSILSRQSFNQTVTELKISQNLPLGQRG